MMQLKGSEANAKHSQLSDPFCGVLFRGETSLGLVSVGTGPVPDERDLVGRDPEGFEKIVVCFRRALFELLMPPFHVGFAEAGRVKQGYPRLLVHGPYAAGERRVPQQTDDDPLLVA